MVNGTSDAECNSPSSDKENKTSNDESVNSSFESSPTKWQPPRVRKFNIATAYSFFKFITLIVPRLTTVHKNANLISVAAFQV